MPMPGLTTNAHGPYCVSPPIGEEIHTQSLSGESVGVSINVVRALDPDHPADTRSRSMPCRVRLLVEAYPGIVTGCVLDHDSGLSLVRALHIALQIQADP
jgi:hypothetical protein